MPTPFDVDAAVNQAQLLAGIQADLLELEEVQDLTGKLSLLSDQLVTTLRQVERQLDS